MKKYLLSLTLGLTFCLIVLAQTAGAQVAQANSKSQKFQLNSTTFSNGGQLPLSMALGSNNCPFVVGGGNQSPELSWTNPPEDTKTFVVTMFDTTASFTHWGMYNISSDTRELPENAGVAGSTFGQQVFNDFFFGAEYDGMCPPNTLTPLVHEYVLTVYALDTELQLTSFPPNFPADAETLYRAMFDHILRQASIHGFFSSAQ